MDACFVYAETPTWHMHVGALFTVDPTTSPEPFDEVRLRHLIASRLNELQPFTGRLVTVPLGLARPNLVHDRPIDLERHIYRAGVPAPGGPRELATLVGELLERKLEPDRPLWELWYIDGLDNGHVALLLKAHHALVDGTRGLQVYEVLFDLTADAPLERQPARAGATAERPPSPIGLLLGAVPWLAGTPLRAAGAMAHAGRSAVRLSRLGRSRLMRRGALPFQAPKTSMNHQITPHRAFSYCSVDLDGVREIRSVFGGTVNDIVLALCGGALRTYFQERDELPQQPLVAQIPVAVNAPNGMGTGAGAQRVWGNQVSLIGASLATGIEDPVDRLRAITESTVTAKAVGKAIGDTLVIDLLGVLPPALIALGVRSYVRLGLAEHHPPIFNLIVSNIRGPTFPLYIAGARLEANYPIGPLLDGSGLNVTVTSYLDRVDFGFVVCPELVEDPWRLAAAVPAEFAELRRAAAKAGESRPSHHPVR
jgi:WS/DGAT/MGAT family acyltransferase